tara:strand:- start:1487 stop:3403 length:1917 start_codon:yes stop_codon:yes gene_type:complete
MCGINGIIYKNNSPDISEIRQMNNAIRHRGPDDEGILKFQNILFGHVRLSIQDLSSKGKQPMSNDGRFWIIYNGEIYNFLEIKKELEQIGHKFYSNTDTEVILNSYKEWGVNSFMKFNGMWAFAILDKKNDKLIISRDRYGVKPFYYYLNKNKIIFSSEIKGIYSSNSKISFDENKIVYDEKYLEGKFTTSFKNVEILPPGNYFEINIKNLKISKFRWWKSLENLKDININFNKSKERMRELLFEATKLRLISDVKISNSLSGGIDSSIIFSILNNLNNIKKADLNPFIYKGDNITFNQALDLVNFYKRKPKIIKKIDKSSIEFSKYLSLIELPQTYFSQLEIYKKQKLNNFKVSIDGHGADECLGGYSKDLQLFPMHYQNSIIGIYQSLSNLEGNEYTTNVIKNYKFVDKLQGYNVNIKNIFYEENYFKQRRKLFSKYITSKKINLISDNLNEDLNELKNFNLPFQILFYHANYGHMQWLLNKWDKASMASSVEIRSPYLDWNFFQYCLSMPAEYKFNFGKNKYILREAFKDILTKSINDDFRKQGLKIAKYKENNEDTKLMEEEFNQKKFKEESIWDGKKILSDFNSIKSKNDQLTKNKIWRIFCLYSLKKGFENIKKESSQKDLKKQLGFNLLNK